MKSFRDANLRVRVFMAMNNSLENAAAHLRRQGYDAKVEEDHIEVKIDDKTQKIYPQDSSEHE